MSYYDIFFAIVTPIAIVVYIIAVRGVRKLKAEYSAFCVNTPISSPDFYPTMKRMFARVSRYKWMVLSSAFIIGMPLGYYTVKLFIL